MAKKKMNPSQAAAARRPDNWVSPEAERQAVKRAESVKAKDFSYDTATEDKGIRKLFGPFVILFVAMAIITPFIVIYVSQFLGLS